MRPDFVVLAVPWSKVAGVVAPEIATSWPWLAEVGSVEAAPITGVHLWFDREIMDLPHAVLVGRLSQWIFNRATPEAGNFADGFYYQVVISGSRQLAGLDREQIVAAVCADLAAVWPAAAEVRLLRSRVVTDRSAVFSARPGLERVRPAQQTAADRVLVAGDWTATGWPATMEVQCAAGTWPVRRFCAASAGRGISG